MFVLITSGDKLATNGIFVSGSLPPRPLRRQQLVKDGPEGERVGGLRSGTVVVVLVEADLLVTQASQDFGGKVLYARGRDGQKVWFLGCVN